MTIMFELNRYSGDNKIKINVNDDTPIIENGKLCFWKDLEEIHEYGTYQIYYNGSWQEATLLPTVKTSKKFIIEIVAERASGVVKELDNGMAIKSLPAFLESFYYKGGISYQIKEVK
jgi:hypothetical protein